MQFDSPAADRITGGILLVLGISMLVGGFMMDRLEIRQIHPASIPGLVPMGLGIALAICALLLIYSARQPSSEDKSAKQATVDTTASESGSYKNLLVTAILSVAYAAGLIGRIPFVVATALFIFSFSVYFLWPDTTDGKSARIRISLLCAVYAVTFAVGISALFRYGFLVRLP